MQCLTPSSLPRSCLASMLRRSNGRYTPLLRGLLCGTSSPAQHRGRPCQATYRPPSATHLRSFVRHAAWRSLLLLPNQSSACAPPCCTSREQQRPNKMHSTASTPRHCWLPLLRCSACACAPDASVTTAPSTSSHITSRCPQTNVVLKGSLSASYPPSTAPPPPAVSHRRKASVFPLFPHLRRQLIQLAVFSMGRSRSTPKPSRIYRSTLKHHWSWHRHPFTRTR
jgi:hypothetical protein